MVHIKRNSNRCPTHPGALLREDVIPVTGRTKAEIAQLLGISRQHLYSLLRERKPV
jgi:antitoxin HigA-1